MDKDMPGNFDVGVDPGVTGAIALLGEDGYLEIIDLDNYYIKDEKRMNWRELDADILLNPLFLTCKSITIERVHSMPRDGHVGAFRFGYIYGGLEGVLSSATPMDIDIQRVTPQTWKKFYGIRAAPKDVSQDLARELFAEYAGAFSRVKDHNRAEAVLIANYGRIKRQKGG